MPATAIAFVIPGLMGSELKLGDELIWPGPLASLVGRYGKMAALMREDLQATDIIRRVSFSSIYKGLIELLGRLKFREDASPPTLYALAYDWRKDCALAAHQLADRLDAAVEAHGGQANVSLIAHSMGGLVARYYLESGTFKDRPGLAAVQRLITLGTPHQGAPLALTAALGKERRLFLSADQVLQLVNDPHFPSVYQLLPPGGEPFAWDSASELRGLDIYDPEVAGSLNLRLANLQAARVFRAALDLARRPAHVRYFFFVGTRQRTSCSVLISRGSNTPVPIVLKVEQDNGGDGTVPSWSATHTGVQSLVVGGEHATIFRNRELQDYMGRLFGVTGVAALAGESDLRVDVALRDRVSRPGGVLHVGLDIGPGVEAFQGELRVEQVSEDGTGGVTVSSAIPLAYTGAEVRNLGVVVRAPEQPGLYRLGFFVKGESAPRGADELFVQEEASS